MFPAHVIRQIAVEADRDPRAVKNVLKGSAKGTTTASVEKAMRRLGIERPKSGARKPR
jgi:hypothetical protein